MRHRMYLKGEPITNPGDAVGIIHGGGYLFFLDRPIHPSWIGSWPVNLLIGACRAGRICRAIPNPDHPKFKEQSK